MFLISTTAEIAGRHVGSLRPDDNEFIIIKLDKPLDKIDGDDRHDDGGDKND